MPHTLHSGCALMPSGQRAAQGPRPGAELRAHSGTPEAQAGGQAQPCPALPCLGPQGQPSEVPAPPAGLSPTGRRFTGGWLCIRRLLLTGSDITGSQWEAGLFPGLTA